MHAKLFRPRLADCDIVSRSAWIGFLVWRLLLTIKTNKLDTSVSRVSTVTYMHLALRRLNLPLDAGSSMKTHVKAPVAKLRRTLTLNASKAFFADARHAVNVGVIAFNRTSSNARSVGITHFAGSAIIACQSTLLCETNTAVRSEKEKEDARRYHDTVVNEGIRKDGLCPATLLLACPRTTATRWLQNVLG